MSNRPYLGRWLLIMMAGGVIAVEAGGAEPTSFRIKPGRPNRVTFTSKAPLETIVGVTEQVSGRLSVDADDLSQPISAEFEVVMASLDTDNRTRNEHMRVNHLHTDRYPTSRFVLKSLKGAPRFLPDGQTVLFTAVGDFTLHGVTRSIEVEVSAGYTKEARIIEVLARFEVSLSDYNIPRPQFLVMRLDELQKIQVNLTAAAD